MTSPWLCLFLCVNESMKAHPHTLCKTRPSVLHYYLPSSTCHLPGTSWPFFFFLLPNIILKDSNGTLWMSSFYLTAITPNGRKTEVQQDLGLTHLAKNSS